MYFFAKFTPLYNFKKRSNFNILCLPLRDKLLIIKKGIYITHLDKKRIHLTNETDSLKLSIVEKNYSLFFTIIQPDNFTGVLALLFSFQVTEYQ